MALSSQDFSQSVFFLSLCQGEPPWLSTLATAWSLRAVTADLWASSCSISHFVLVISLPGDHAALTLVGQAWGILIKQLSARRSFDFPFQLPGADGREEDCAIDSFSPLFLPLYLVTVGYRTGLVHSLPCRQGCVRDRAVGLLSSFHVLSFLFAENKQKQTAFLHYFKIAIGDWSPDLDKRKNWVTIFMTSASKFKMNFNLTSTLIPMTQDFTLTSPLWPVMTWHSSGKNIKCIYLRKKVCSY